MDFSDALRALKDGHTETVMVRHANGQASIFVMIDPHLPAEGWETEE